jgi:hypothetical protein
VSGFIPETVETLVSVDWARRQSTARVRPRFTLTSITTPRTTKKALLYHLRAPSAKRKMITAKAKLSSARIRFSLFIIGYRFVITA